MKLPLMVKVFLMYYSVMYSRMSHQIDVHMHLKSIFSSYVLVFFFHAVIINLYILLLQHFWKICVCVILTWKISFLYESCGVGNHVWRCIFLSVIGVNVILHLLVSNIFYWLLQSLVQCAYQYILFVLIIVRVNLYLVVVQCHVQRPCSTSPNVILTLIFIILFFTYSFYLRAAIWQCCEAVTWYLLLIVNRIEHVMLRVQIVMHFLLVPPQIKVCQQDWLEYHMAHTAVTTEDFTQDCVPKSYLYC